MSQPSCEPATAREAECESPPSHSPSALPKLMSGCRAQVGACAYPSCRCHLPLTGTVTAICREAAT
jgi:hypothetical protein